MLRALTLAGVLVSTLSMHVLAQSTTAPAPAPAATTTAPAADAAVMLTAEQAESWVGKPVYTSDGKNVGEVAAFARGTDDKVTEMHADIGGFLGLGETRVKLMPDQFKLSGDRVTITMTSAETKNLPRVK